MPAQPESVSLAQLRRRLGKSQTEVALATGTKQSAVSRLEGQDDMLVSTLQDYVNALGRRLRISVQDSAGREIEVIVGGRDAAESAERAREFRVVWQDPGSRSLIHVAWLRFDGRRYSFTYTDEARRHAGFAPFPAFPDLDQVYESSELFEFFRSRFEAFTAADQAKVLDALGLAANDATPLELLARTPASPHDLIQVVPEPVEAPDGTLERSFLVSGVRHAGDPDEVSALIDSLQMGDQLTLRPEPDNEFNPSAVQILADNTVVGWVPDYLADEMLGLISSGGRWRLTVERANGPDVPWHLRLLCALAIAPD